MIRLLPLLLAGALSASVPDDLKRLEGFRGTAYLDTQGFWTCGYGHRCAEGTKMTLLAAEKALADDISSAEHAAKRAFPTFAGHPQHVKDVLVELCFQLGETGMRKFVKFGQAIAAHDYESAGNHLLDSKFHHQTKQRCEELARKLSNE
jgi:GH24 family phage-related lysozyme (muramidase)